jgi:hypothetical protein
VLWLVFVAVLGVLGDRLLRACAIGRDWPAVIAALLPQHCPLLAAEPDGALESLRVAIQSAEAQVRSQELALTRRIATCQHSCPAPAIQRAELPAVTPPQISQDISTRLENVQRGQYLELTLAWEGPADLDLHVSCPDRNQISFSSRVACGGRLVADLNSSFGTSSPRPIEHIIWNEEPVPRGEYSIQTKLYDRKGDSRTAIPYRLVISRHGRVIREHAGELSDSSSSQSPTSFTSPLN